MAQHPTISFGEQATAEIAGLIERLTTAAAAEKQAALESAEAEARVIQEELRNESAALKDELTQRAQERRDLESKIKHASTETAAAREAQAKAEAAAREAQVKTEAAIRVADDARKAADDARKAVEDTRKAAEDARKLDAEQREALERAASDATSALDTARLEASALAEQLAAATSARSLMEQEARRLASEAESARHAASQAAIDLETAIDEASAIQVAQSNELRDQVVGSVSRALDGLLNTYRKLTVSKAVPDVLDALTGGLANDFARVALFNVVEDRLEGVRQLGFTVPTVTGMTIPLNAQSFLTDAVKSGRVQGRTASAMAGKSSPFGGSPGFVLVVPIVLRGKSIAVIYADDAGQSSADFTTPEQRVKLAQLLLYLAVSRMPRLLPQNAPMAEAKTA